VNRSIDLEAVRTALRAAGLNVGALRLVNPGRTLVVADGERAIRISDADPSQIERELRTTILLGVAGAPVLTPLDPVPVESVLGTVSLWPLADKSPRPEEDLGTTLRELHLVGATLAYGQPLNRSKVRRMVMELEVYGVDPATTALLRSIAAELPEVPSWQREPSGVLLHGDAHNGNIMRVRGRPVLIDAGGAQSGPWQLDLVPTWVAARRGRDGWGNWQAVKDSYDPALLADGLWDWEHLAEAVLERELLTTLFLCRMWRRLDWVRDEVGLRLRSWTGNTEPWNIGR
jgi:hypothetical protein